MVRLFEKPASGGVDNKSRLPLCGKSALSYLPPSKGETREGVVATTPSPSLERRGGKLIAAVRGRPLDNKKGGLVSSRPRLPLVTP